MRRILASLTIVVLGAFALSCLAGEPTAKLALSKEEKAGITAAVRKETNEPILNITRKSPDTITVQTGKVTPGRLDGGGKVFKFKHTKKGWELQKELTGDWIS